MEKPAASQEKRWPMEVGFPQAANHQGRGFREDTQAWKEDLWPGDRLLPLRPEQGLKPV